MLENENLNEAENSVLNISDVSGSVIDTDKVAFFGQFDNDEPFEIMSGFGKEVTLKMQPDNGTIEFTCIESGKRFKMFVKHCH